MIWIELIQATRIHGIMRHAGYRTPYPRLAAKELISRGKAKFVNNPHPGRSDAGYPKKDQEDDTTENDTKHDEDYIEDPKALLLKVDGIGDATADKILKELGDKVSAKALLDSDLTELPKIGESKAKDLRRRLAELV